MLWLQAAVRQGSQAGPHGGCTDGTAPRLKARLCAQLLGHGCLNKCDDSHSGARIQALKLPLIKSRNSLYASKTTRAVVWVSQSRDPFNCYFLHHWHHYKGIICCCVFSYGFHLLSVYLNYLPNPQSAFRNIKHTRMKPFFLSHQHSTLHLLLQQEADIIFIGNTSAFL